MAASTRAVQTTTQGEATRPPHPGLVERYADHLFDGPAGQDFLGALSQGYRELARERDSASDFGDAAKFLQRAGAASHGERVWPEEIFARVLPMYALQDLIYARMRLMRAFDRGADQRFPRVAARAQVAFDCWMESQEENRYPEYVHRCRQTFEQAMSQLEEVPKQSMREMPPVSPAKGSEPQACAQTACKPLRLYFALDKAELSQEERQKLDAWVAEFAKHSTGKIVLAAHTDRSASVRYNDALAKRRLAHVLSLLRAAGIERDRIIEARAYGEREVPVPTPDGVVEQENRVVEVWLLSR